jgi:hypothetical protein
MAFKSPNQGVVPVILLTVTFATLKLSSTLIVEVPIPKALGISVAV